MKRSLAAVLGLSAVGAVLGLAGQARAITLDISQDTLTSTSATFILTLDFTDAQPSDLMDVETARISLAGSTPSLVGLASFTPASQWDTIVPFGSGLDPNTVDLLWDFANPTLGLEPGSTSQLGTLTLDLSGLSGQSVLLKLDGGSDPNVDMTQIAGVDSNLNPVQIAPGFNPAELNFDVPAGTNTPAVPEPASAGLALLGIGSLAWSIRRRQRGL